MGRIYDLVSIYKYLYANANLMNYTDASGHFSLQKLRESILLNSKLFNVNITTIFNTSNAIMFVVLVII